MASVERRGQWRHPAALQDDEIASIPDASSHQHIHTDLYCANVVAELAGPSDTSDARELRGVMKSISSGLVRGQFATETHTMQLWNWNGASNGFTSLVPVRDKDILTGVFNADGTPKAWASRPQVMPGIERVKKKQSPLGDLSFVMGASVVLNEKAHTALQGFLRPFGQFLELDMIDETGIGGGDQNLYFYNVTNVVSCIDFDRSETEAKKVVRPAFNFDAVPVGVQVFKDPLRKKSDIYLTEGARDELTRLIAANDLRGSTISRVS